MGCVALQLSLYFVKMKAKNLNWKRYICWNSSPTPHLPVPILAVFPMRPDTLRVKCGYDEKRTLESTCIPGCVAPDDMILQSYSKGATIRYFVDVLMG